MKITEKRLREAVRQQMRKDLNIRKKPTLTEAALRRKVRDALRRGYLMEAHKAYDGKTYFDTTGDGKIDSVDSRGGNEPNASVNPDDVPAGAPVNRKAPVDGGGIDPGSDTDSDTDSDSDEPEEKEEEELDDTPDNWKKDKEKVKKIQMMMIKTMNWNPETDKKTIKTALHCRSTCPDGFWGDKSETLWKALGGKDAPNLAIAQATELTKVAEIEVSGKKLQPGGGEGEGDAGEGEPGEGQAAVKISEDDDQVNYWDMDWEKAGSNRGPYWVSSIAGGAARVSPHGVSADAYAFSALAVTKTAGTHVYVPREAHYEKLSEDDEVRLPDGSTHYTDSLPDFEDIEEAWRESGGEDDE